MPPAKIMIVGDSKVGKTAIQKRYCIVNKVDKFFAALIHEIEVELQQFGEAEIGRVMFYIKFDFLMNKFCTVTAEFIAAMLDIFHDALVPVSIACFFAENGYANKLQKLFPGLSQDFWLRFGVPLQQMREQSNQFVPAVIEAEFVRYTQMMRKYQEGEYSALLTADLKFKQDFSIDADEYVPTYVPTTDMLETEKNGDVIVCDTPAVDDWERFFDGFMPFGPMIDAILLVYDIGNRNSFDRIQHYRRQLKTIFKIGAERDGVEDWTEEPLFMLLGNKCDLADDARQVRTAEGKSRAICFDMPFMEVSARENINIESAFIILAEAVKKKREGEEMEEIVEQMMKAAMAAIRVGAPILAMFG